jgi:hypothetical protein
MSTPISAEELQKHFERIRSEQGEETYQKARRNFALGMILKDRGEEFLRHLFPDMDFAEIRAAAEKNLEAFKSTGPNPFSNPQEAVLNAVRGQVPNLKTQAQFTLFMQAFEALRVALNSAFGLDHQGFNQSRAALNLLLDASLSVTEVGEKLAEIPEAATSAAAEALKQPPKEFGEQDLQTSLLAELEMLKNAEELQKWYDNNRSRIDGVVSQPLRNGLFDAIRAKRNAISSN